MFEIVLRNLQNMFSCVNGWNSQIFYYIFRYYKFCIYIFIVTFVNYFCYDKNFKETWEVNTDSFKASLHVVCGGLHLLV